MGDMNMDKINGELTNLKKNYEYLNSQRVNSQVLNVGYFICV